MSATVIAFPARRRDNTPTTFDAALREFSAARAREAARNAPSPTRPVVDDGLFAQLSKVMADACEPAFSAPEKEILKLLRRIDRRLAKLAEGLPSDRPTDRNANCRLSS